MEERQGGSELRYKAIDEVANSHPASSYTLWYLDLDFISINGNFNAAKIFLMILFFFSQSLWCHSRGRIWFHALKSSTVKFKIKTVSFYPTWTQNCDILKKSFIWNAHWCTSEALKIILIAWARCWLGGLMQKSANSQQQGTDSYFHQASWTTHWITSQGSYHLH